MVLLTGGPRSCAGGRCDGLERVWNETAATLAVLPASSDVPSLPHLGLVDCDADGVLCTTWFAGPPALWHVVLPPRETVTEDGRPQSPARRDPVARIIGVNASTVTVKGLVDVHRARRFEEQKPLGGRWTDPFAGPLARYGVLVPVGYMFFALSKVPSWMVMVVMSFGTRMLM